MLCWDRTAAKMLLQTLHFSLLTVGILKQVSAFRVCCMQAYADGLAAKHFEQQNKIQELASSSSWILCRRSKCLAARPSARLNWQRQRLMPRQGVLGTPDP